MILFYMKGESILFWSMLWILIIGFHNFSYDLVKVFLIKALDGTNFCANYFLCLIITESAAKVCDRCGTSFVLQGHYRENRVNYLPLKNEAHKVRNAKPIAAMEGEGVAGRSTWRFRVCSLLVQTKIFSLLSIILNI
jgi:hypothetical protein